MQPYSSNVSPSDTTLVLITNALGAMLLLRDRGPSPWTPSRSWAGLRHTVAKSRSGSQMVVVACARAWLAALVEYIDIHYAGCAVRVRLEPGHKNAHNRLFRFLKARGRHMSMCRVNSGTVKCSFGCILARRRDPVVGISDVHQGTLKTSQVVAGLDISSTQ